MKPSADVVLTYGLPYGCMSLLLPFIRSQSSESNSSHFHTAIKRSIKKQVILQATLSLLIEVLNSNC